MDGFSYTELFHMFPLEISRSQFYYMEAQGTIPKALREDGKVRLWPLESIPTIGKLLAPINLPSHSLYEICIYVSKGGGSHKTTLAFNFAKYCGMRGLKTLVVPLDFQQNMTSKFNYLNTSQQSYPGLFEVAEKKISIKDTILPTNYPNIHLIPEGPNLVRLDLLMASKSFREEYISNLLAPIKKDYDVIIYDNNPAWSNLALASIYSSSIMLCPIGVDSHTVKTLPIFYENMSAVFEMKKTVAPLFIPGFVENNLAKQDNLLTIRETFPNLVTNNEIRKSTLIDEANTANLSIFEYAPRASVTEDYRRVCNEIWTRLLVSSSQRQL